MTATRSGEARGARWSEFDLATQTWTIPAERIEGRQGAPRAAQRLRGRSLAAMPRSGDSSSRTAMPGKPIEHGV